MDIISSDSPQNIIFYFVICIVLILLGFSKFLASNLVKGLRVSLLSLKNVLWEIVSPTNGNGMRVLLFTLYFYVIGDFGFISYLAHNCEIQCHR